MLKIQLFGDIRLFSSRGPITIPRRKELALLAFLIVEAGQAHARQTLLGLLWPELPESDARNNLRVALARLRRSLQKGGAPADALESTRRTVTFHLTPAMTCDITTFQNLLRQTEQHAHDDRSRCPACRETLTAAAALYQGALLPGLFLDDCAAFEEWLFVWRERLHLGATEALEDLAEGLEEDGRYPAATRFARRLIELDPLHDSTQHRLLRLLTYQNQHNAALQQFETYAALLKTELGVEPDLSLLQLVEQIKNRTLLQNGAEAAHAHHHNLPEDLTPFFGRTAELIALNERLANPSYRLISLVGPGGIGKTRLAIQAARTQLDNFPDGVYFISLVGVEAVQHIPATIAETIGVPLAGTAPPDEQIITILHGQKLLLIIDNMEHLMDGVPLLLNIIARAPGVVLLVTGRERLNVQAEDLFRLKGLPYPQNADDPTAVQSPAVRLFADRAHRLHKKMRVDGENLPHIVRICQLVEGLPLGLELAATWVRDYPIAKIVAAIAQDIALLETDLRDVDPRHQSIQGVFEYSWRLLSAEEQRVLPWLSLFRGTFTGAAATEITASSPLVLRRLRYKSLLRHEGNGRYSLHELLRQLAEKHLHQLPEAVPAAKRAHAAYYLQLVTGKSPLLNEETAAQTAAELRHDIDNIRAAWETAVKQRNFGVLDQSAESIVHFFKHIGLNLEIETLLQGTITALQAGGGGFSPANRLKLELLLLDLRCLYRHPEQFDTDFSRFMGKLQKWTHPDKPIFEAKAVYYHSYALAEGGSPQVAIAQCEKALALASEIDDPIHLGYVLCQRAFYHYRDRQLDDALAALNTAAGLFNRSGDLKGLARVEDRLAPAYAENGNYWKALVHDKNALNLYKRLGNERMIPKGHQGVGLSCVILGDYAAARHHFNQTIELAQKMGFASWVKAGMGGLAEVEFLEGHIAEAKRLYQRCLARRRQDNEDLRYCIEGSDMARLLWYAGEHVEGLKLMAEILPIWEKLGNKADIQMAQATQALLLWELGQGDEAIQTIEALWPQIGPYSLGEPVKTLFEIYTVLDRADHPLVKEVITVAHTVLKKLTNDIPHAAQRTIFLENVPFCRWLRAGFVKHYLTDPLHS